MDGRLAMRMLRLPASPAASEESVKTAMPTRTACAAGLRGIAGSGSARSAARLVDAKFPVKRMLSTGCDGFGFANPSLLHMRCSGPRWRSVPTRTFAHREVALAQSAAGPGTGCRLVAAFDQSSPAGVPARDDKEVI